MERHGIRVDPERLGAFAKELERSLDNLTREIWQLAGEEFTIASPKQLAHILFEKLGLPALRRTKTGYSTDADVLTELALGHPDRKSTRLNSSHGYISYAVFCLKKKNQPGRD